VYQSRFPTSNSRFFASIQRIWLSFLLVFLQLKCNCDLICSCSTLLWISTVSLYRKLYLTTERPEVELDIHSTCFMQTWGCSTRGKDSLGTGNWWTGPWVLKFPQGKDANKLDTRNPIPSSLCTEIQHLPSQGTASLSFSFFGRGDHHMELKPEQLCYWTGCIVCTGNIRSIDTVCFWKTQLRNLTWRPLAWAYCSVQADGQRIADRKYSSMVVAEARSMTMKIVLFFTFHQCKLIG
jgi:hypothetical protein